MTWPDIFLLCFGVGSFWSFVSLLLGGMHLGHGTGAGTHGHSGGLHTGSHIGGHHALGGRTGGHSSANHSPSWLGSMVNPSCAAVFLAWFGGIGYILPRHSTLGLALDLVIAVSLGLVGASILAAFLRFLQSREKPLDPADYEMVGVLGRVASRIRPGGVGEVIYVQDGVRKPVPARSDDGIAIDREAEVIVTRYEKGIAYVRTWEAMTQGERLSAGGQSSPKEKENVE